MMELREHPNSDALSWLLEMELVNTPYAINSLVLNMFMAIKGVRDVELVIDEKQKKILVYLKLSWFHQRFKCKQVEDSAKDLIHQVLPSFQNRIVFDRNILEKAVAIANKQRGNP